METVDRMRAEGRGWWVNSFFALIVILGTLVYIIIWSTLHKVSLFLWSLYDVPWASFYVHIIAKKSFLLQLMDNLVSFFNTLMSSFILLLAVYIVLSSAKVASSLFLINKKQSFMTILNKMGPEIEPCGTPNKKYLKCAFH